MKRIRVLVKKNYDYPDFMQQSPNEDGVWENVAFVDEAQECDVLVVMNYIRKDFWVKMPKGRKVLLIQEPPYAKKKYFKANFASYDLIVTAFKDNRYPQIRNIPAGLPWHLKKSFKELSDLKYSNKSKMDQISWITSANNNHKGHEVRLKFLQWLQDSKINFDLFGRGFHPIDDKFDGIYPYKYSIAVENYSDHDYFTEKIMDVFLSWSMPIYYGCKNIVDYFPPESMILIDIEKPAEAFEIIKKAVADDLWSKNIEAIREARNLVLNKYQTFPMIKELIEKELDLSDKPKIKTYNSNEKLTQFQIVKKRIKQLLKEI